MSSSGPDGSAPRAPSKGRDGGRSQGRMIGGLSLVFLVVVLLVVVVVVFASKPIPDFFAHYPPLSVLINNTGAIPVVTGQLP